MSGADGGATFLRLLLLVVGAVALALVAPFLQALLSAGLVAYLVAPVNRRLATRLGPTVGTTVTILATVVVAVVPLALVVGVAAEQALAVARTASLPDAAAVQAGLRPWLAPMPELDGFTGPLVDALRMGFRGLLGGVLGVLGGIPGFLVGTVVFLFALFYLLRDGERLLGWLRRAAPLDPATADRLVERTDALLWAAVVGNVAVAGVQAVLTAVGFVALGIENVVFWGLATFLLSLLPIIGASIVWLPAVGYLLLVGRVPAAAVLLVYGSVVVSGSDNLVRPLVMQRGTDLNAAVLVLGIFGGVSLFGFVGLFVGPVILGLAKSLVDVLAGIPDERHGHR
ncbi:AI-2E family transporter [Haloarcula onubensis]|uniref:AI-2E family transporter n=1 Tax=Haloarcula onubensis TaxID=2950539 RepID=A0ABU2FLB6_9EURY|nr:AI-2E family transporter [Halomicroarcula sp. S3CR25-11]MDS0280986.1 AI-2E family transporter [Halomicroarcula sp. S3CR25-11]